MIEKGWCVFKEVRSMRCSLGKKGKKGEVLPRSTGGDGVAESGHETQDNERTFSDNLAPAKLINR